MEKNGERWKEMERDRVDGERLGEIKRYVKKLGGFERYAEGRIEMGNDGER